MCDWSTEYVCQSVSSCLSACVRASIFFCVCMSIFMCISCLSVNLLACVSVFFLCACLFVCLSVCVCAVHVMCLWTALSLVVHGINEWETTKKKKKRHLRLNNKFRVCPSNGNHLLHPLRFLSIVTIFFFLLVFPCFFFILPVFLLLLSAVLMGGVYQKGLYPSWPTDHGQIILIGNCKW